MDKGELVAAIRMERAELEEALAGLSREQIVRTALPGAWSVKDTLAHIVAWEQWMIGWTGQILRGETPHHPRPVKTDNEVDRLNAESYERNRDRVLEEVEADFRRSYDDALRLAESLPAERLQEEHPDTWPHGPLWYGVAANTCWHYREHLESIRTGTRRSDLSDALTSDA